jgi:hypothetical protein
MIAKTTSAFRFVILVFLSLNFNFTVDAKEYPIHSRVYSTSANPINTNVPIMGFVPSPVGAGGTFNDVSAKGVFTMGVDFDHSSFLNSSATYTINVVITKYNSAGAPTTVPKTMVVDYNPLVNTLTNRDQCTAVLNDCYSADITISGISDGTNNLTTLPFFLYIDGLITVERYYTLVNGQINIQTANLFDYDCDTQDDEFEFVWAHQLNDVFEEYQLEWTYINDYDPLGAAIPANSLNIDFRNNSTRITTLETKYRIPLLFDRGWLVYRIRGVTRDLSGQHNIYGPWTTPDGTIAVSAVGGQFYLPIAFENKKNWQLSTTFAEGGKKKEVVNYADGSLRSRQSLTRINTDEHVIIAETVYDSTGRPAVNILPVPNYHDCNGISDQTLKYYVLFNQNTNGEKYSAKDFDQDAQLFWFRSTRSAEQEDIIPHPIRFKTITRAWFQMLMAIHLHKRNILRTIQEE